MWKWKWRLKTREDFELAIRQGAAVCGFAAVAVLGLIYFDAPGYDKDNFLDVIGLGVCAYFLLTKKSRIAAAVALLDFAATKVMNIMNEVHHHYHETGTNPLMTIVYGYILVRTLIATVKWHRPLLTRGQVLESGD
jgi:hypothetical protein